jgi:hypothetical protein
VPGRRRRGRRRTGRWRWSRWGGLGRRHGGNDLPAVVARPFVTAATDGDEHEGVVPGREVGPGRGRMAALEPAPEPCSHVRGKVRVAVRTLQRLPPDPAPRPQRPLAGLPLEGRRRLSRDGGRGRGQRHARPGGPSGGEQQELKCSEGREDEDTPSHRARDLSALAEKVPPAADALFAAASGDVSSVAA